MDRAVDGVEVTAYGECGLLIQVRDVTRDPADVVTGWAEAVRSAAVTGVVDVVPAARSVLVHVADGRSRQRVRDIIAGLQPSPSVGAEGRSVVEIPVVYDGPDLAGVASATGWTSAEIVAAHTGTLWRAAFAGFAPGFAYLVCDDPWPAVPRRAEPRTRVPAGSVALAAGYSAVYPRASPGGWQLIGHTDQPMWDLRRDPPAVLSTGQRVRFVAASR